VEATGKQNKIQGHESKRERLERWKGRKKGREEERKVSMFKVHSMHACTL
jgi:hypothetical protein